MPQLKGQKEKLFYGERRRLSGEDTDALLSGRTDGLAGFEKLACSTAEQVPEKYQWGYTQIVHRAVFQDIRYAENLNSFSQTDGLFAEACQARNIIPQPIEGVFCLHLEHPFSWYGTNIYL